MPTYAYVYILANGFRKLYIGITTNLQQRILDHKTAKHPESHTARYHIHQLVYFERFTTIPAAIAREKQLKGWLRIPSSSSSSPQTQAGKTSAKTGKNPTNLRPPKSRRHQS